MAAAQQLRTVMVEIEKTINATTQGQVSSATSGPVVFLPDTDSVVRCRHARTVTPQCSDNHTQIRIHVYKVYIIVYA